MGGVDAFSDVGAAEENLLDIPVLDVAMQGRTMGPKRFFAGVRSEPIRRNQVELQTRGTMRADERS